MGGIKGVVNWNVVLGLGCCMKRGCLMGCGIWGVVLVFGIWEVIVGVRYWGLRITSRPLRYIYNSSHYHL